MIKYDGVYTNVYMALWRWLFLDVLQPRKSKFLMVVDDREPYADEAVFFLLLVQLVECSHVLLALLPRWSSLEIISSPPRASDDRMLPRI